MERRVRITHAGLVHVLRRTGYPPDEIDEIAAHLPEPIDVDRDSRLLARYGLTRERLMDRMGASP
jgi:hypothetical protein